MRRTIRARDLAWGAVLTLVARQTKTNIGALDAFEPVSVDLHYDDLDALHARLDEIGTWRAMPPPKKAKGVRWYVPATWTETTPTIDLGRLRCEPVDFAMHDAEIQGVLQFFADIMGLELRGEARGTMTLLLDTTPCHQLLRTILELTGTSARLEGKVLTLRPGPEPPPHPAAAPSRECPDEFPVPPELVDHHALACYEPSQVRLAAVAIDRAGPPENRWAVLVPQPELSGPPVIARLGQSISMLNARAMPTIYTLGTIDEGRVVLTTTHDLGHREAVVVELSAASP